MVTVRRYINVTDRRTDDRRSKLAIPRNTHIMHRAVKNLVAHFLTARYNIPHISTARLKLILLEIILAFRRCLKFYIYDAMHYASLVTLRYVTLRLVRYVSGSTVVSSNRVTRCRSGCYWFCFVCCISATCKLEP